MPPRGQDGRAPGLAVCRDGSPRPAPGAVAAIGNFDGLHRGHQHMLGLVRDWAARVGGAAAVLTFEPHPRDLFRPEDPSFRLTPEPVKLRLLEAFGMDLAFVRRFDSALAATEAGDFVAGLLGHELKLAGVVVGESFRFGRARTGDVDFLRRAGASLGLQVLAEPPVEMEGAPVSSSRIRAALAAGDVALANRLLGYRWFVEGEVIHGEKRGRTLGFPTANMALPASCRLAHGIYAVRAAIGPGRVAAGVASFGRRPTFDDGAPLLETFLFDVDESLYGRMIAVELLDWIRPEERFGSAEDLVARMQVDADQARAVATRADGHRSFIGG
ncbi:MAG: riboflavin biosynthesis protein RibF [Enterovirga sp.]|nr:riboflavin biosynthesis protein RibF [Enterovirga sp.]